MLVLKQYRNKILIMILTLIILYSAFLFVILPKMNISQVKVQDVFSVPFQQTARYLKTYPSDITDQEAEAIDRILEYNKIAENYNPESSDPVKSLYRQNARVTILLTIFMHGLPCLCAIPLSIFKPHSTTLTDIFTPMSRGNPKIMFFGG